MLYGIFGHSKHINFSRTKEQLVFNLDCLELVRALDGSAVLDKGVKEILTASLKLLRRRENLKMKQSHL